MKTTKFYRIALKLSMFRDAGYMNYIMIKEYLASGECPTEHAIELERVLSLVKEVR